MKAMTKLRRMLFVIATVDERGDREKMSTLGGPLSTQTSLSGAGSSTNLKPQLKKIQRYYAFVESVEPVYITAGDSTYPLPTEASHSPVGYWIELDCIDKDHFDSVVAGSDNIELLSEVDKSEISAESIAMRRALHNDLVESQANLLTVYIYITHDHDMRGSILEIYEVSMWHQIIVQRFPERIEFDPTDQADIMLTDLLVALEAPDAYTGQSFFLANMMLDGIQPGPDLATRLLELGVRRLLLEEIFSLNHIPDIDIPDGDGSAGPIGPLPVPVGSLPISEFKFIDTFLLAYRFRGHIGGQSFHGEDNFHELCKLFWGDGFQTQHIQIVFDDDEDHWKLSCGDRKYRSFIGLDGSRSWQQYEGPGEYEHWSMYFFQDKGFAAIVPRDLCRLESAVTPEHNFSTKISIPASEEWQWIKVRG